MYYWLIGIINPALYFSIERRFRSKKNALLVLLGLFYLVSAKTRDSGEGGGGDAYALEAYFIDSSVNRLQSADSGLKKTPETIRDEPVFF